MSNDLSLRAITNGSYDDNYANESYDDEYMDDGVEIDDFDTDDLQDEKFLPHLFNCIESLTKVVPEVKAVQQSIRGNHDKETIEVLQKLLPQMKNSNSDLNVLSDLVGTFVAQDQLDEDSDKRKEQIKAICEMVMKVYPNKSFYQLITRWSRKKKQDFIKDSVNTVLVLKSHCGDLAFDCFLNQCRDIYIIPPSINGRKYLCITMNTNKNYRPVQNACNLVTQLDMSMQLMYDGITSINDITLSRIRMDTVSKKQSFTLPGPKDLVCDEHDDSGIQIQTNALTGIHLLSSFRKRIWLYFDTVKLTKMLFDTVLGLYIKQYMYKKKKKSKKVMQFFYNCIGGQATRQMYMSVLVDVALVFQTLDDINSHISMIKATCIEGQESQFVSAYKDSTVRYDNDNLI